MEDNHGEYQLQGFVCARYTLCGLHTLPYSALLPPAASCCQCLFAHMLVIPHQKDCSLCAALLKARAILQACCQLCMPLCWQVWQTMYGKFDLSSRHVLCSFMPQ